jgi:hypothetical protein
VTVADSIPDTDARLSVVTDEPVRAIDVARLGTVMTRTDHLVEIALDVKYPTDLSTLELLSCTQLRLELRRVRLAVQMSMDIALSDASFC